MDLQGARDFLVRLFILFLRALTGERESCRWKHAVSCHAGSVSGELGYVFEEDEVYKVLKGL